ncbi:MAG: hypothetical protein KDN20_19555 [Verrucomicrobiae bacterium]|nr:hypothetical protein [Verrucomicrobiae bacterium]
MGLELDGCERVFVFCGPHNHQLKTDPKWSGELTLIKLKSKGDNNLDFHLTLYLGLHHKTADPSTEFLVVSQDQGFDGMLKHLKKMGRVCRRVAKQHSPKTVKRKGTQDLSETALLIIEFLSRVESKSWPARKPKSLNQIKSLLRFSHPDLDPEPVFAELIETGIVQEKDARLVWNEKKIQLAAGPQLVTAA